MAPRSPRRRARAVVSVIAGSVVSMVAAGVADSARGQTVLLQDGSLVLPTVDALGPVVLAVDNGTLSLGTTTFAKPAAAAPYFRNAVFTNNGGLILGNGKSFALAGDIAGNGGVSVIPSTLSVGTWTLMGNNTFSGPVRVDAAPGATQATLNVLAFNGASALGSAGTISLNGVGAAVGFLGGATPYTVTQPMQTTGGSLAVLDRGSRADVTYAGAIGGATGGLTRVGGGILTLSATNSFVGGFTQAAAGDAVTNAASDANLGASGGTVTLQSGILRLGAAFAGSNRPLRFGNGGGVLDLTGDVTWSGALSNVGVVPGAITKTGAGNLLATNVNNSFGSLTIAAGTVTAGGQNGRLQAAATGSIGVLQGGALVVDNSVASLARLTGTAGVALSGGTLRLVGNGTANSSVVSSGSLSLGSPLNNSGQGLSVIRIEPGPSAHGLVRFGSLGRNANNGAMALFSGAGLGDFPIASLSAGRSNVQFTTAPVLVNGILPYAVIDNGAGMNLASYNATNGVVPVVYDSGTVNNPGIATFNVAVGSDATVAGGGTVNAVKFTGGTINLSAGTLVVTSGAMLFTGPTTITGGTLTIGVGTNNTTQAPTGNLFVQADTTIASRLFGFPNNGGGNGSGLAKSGPGVLTLSGANNSFQSPTRVLEGTLRAGASNVIPDGNLVILNPGATFDLNGFNETISSLAQPQPPARSGNDPVGTVNVGPGVLTLGGDGVISTAVGHEILGTGTIIKNGQGTFTVVGGQSFSGTLSIGAGTLELGTHDTRGIGFGNATRINLGTATNADVALRIDDGARSFDRPVLVQAVAGRTATLAFGDDVGVSVTAPLTVSNAQGLIVDAAGGPSLDGLISGLGPVTLRSTGQGAFDSGRYAVRVTGPNTYTGVTTVAARTVVFSTPQAFGNASSAVLLGSSEGDDNPELSGDAAMTFTRPITVQGSFNGSVSRAALGSRAPSEAGTLTYAGAVNIAGNRSKLVVFSTNGAPVSFAGAISGGTLANVQVGGRFDDEDDVTTRSAVYLSGANTYAGGTSLAAGTLGVAGPTLVSLPGNVIASSPLGTGPLTIGVEGVTPVGHTPTLVAAGQFRAILNPVQVRRDFNIAGSNVLTLAGAIDLGDSPRTVTVMDQTAQFTGSASGTGSAGLVKAGPGGLTLAASNTLPGGLTAAGGTLTATGTQRLTGEIRVEGGAVLRVTGTSGAVLVGGSLAVDAESDGVLDLTDRGLIVDYASASPLVDVTNLIASGRNGGTWDGAGIQSSVAAGSPGLRQGIGVAEASELGLTTFLGESFTGDAVLARHTLLGDSTLDGAVDIADFARLAANFNQAGGWYGGDYDYSGTTDIADFAVLAVNFNQALPATPGRLASAAVPEPATWVGLSGLATWLWARRRRSNR